MKNTRVTLAMATAVLLGGALSVTAAPQAHAVTCTGVSVTTASNVQTVINNNPGGTTFCFASGTYTGVNNVVPKAGDVLDGNSQGAVLDGGGSFQSSFSDGGVSGVTVQGFKIQNYNPPLFGGAVNARGGANWIIQNNNISGNGEAGVVTGSGVQVLNNTLDNNVREGFNAQGSNILYQGNDISNNNPNLTDDPGVEAGAGKLWKTTSATFKNNTVNDNGGPGLWADTNNIATTFTGNTVTNNYGPGIYEEISYDFTITGNDVENNGTSTSRGGGEGASLGWLEDAGIELRDSQGNVSGNGITGYGDSVISGNTVYDNFNAIALIEDGDPSPQTGCNNTGEGAYGPCKIAYVDTTNNGITMSSGSTHLGTGAVNSGTDTSVYSGHNTFSGNNYCVSPDASWFQWNGSADSWTTWKGLGFDTSGTYTVTASKCLPPGAQAPAVTTTAATGVTSSGATLNGTVNPEGQAATWQFQYGTTTAYGSTAPASPGSAGSGTTAVAENAAVTGLTASTIYHYRLTATNGTGTTNGADQQFTTSAAGGTAVAYDSTGPSSAGAKCTNCATLSWTHTVGSGSSRALLAEVAVGRNPDTACTLTVKDGTTTLSLLSGPVRSTSSTGFESVYDLVNPPSGANTITVTLGGCSSSGATLTGGSESFTGVSQTAPFGTPVTAPLGVGTAPTATVTTVSSSDLVAGFVVNGSSILSSAKTSRYIANSNNNTAGGNSAGATAAATGGNVAMAWTVTNDNWAVIAVEVLHA